MIRPADPVVGGVPGTPCTLRVHVLGRMVYETRNATR